MDLFHQAREFTVIPVAHKRTARLEKRDATATAAEQPVDISMEELKGPPLRLDALDYFRQIHAALQYSIVCIVNIEQLVGLDQKQGLFAVA